MKLLAIAITFLFLFAFGTGEAYCFCTDSDECQGSVSQVAEAETLSAVSSESSDYETLELSNSITSDCCSDCFKSMNTSILTGTVPDLSDSSIATLQSCVYLFSLADLLLDQPNSIRAPPVRYGPGTKTYLAKRVFLI